MLKLEVGHVQLSVCLAQTQDSQSSNLFSSPVFLSENIRIRDKDEGGDLLDVVFILHDRQHGAHVANSQSSREMLLMPTLSWKRDKED